ncbi:MAG TPA: glycosyltransferase family 2 protein [Bacteroidetes bacterium]|nr:glycosyltransferase family 2 protein [Bacteroidota bacterium]
MTGTEIAFWIAVGIVFYAHLGYGILLFILVKLKRIFGKKPMPPGEKNYEPEVTFIVAAYNEEDWIEDKIRNCLAFDYPKNKIEYWFVTDGSDDTTPDLIKNFKAPNGVKIKLFHQPERNGKIAAVERIMPLVKTPITIFTDANTDVNAQAIRQIVKHYQDPKVGAVAGEKRISVGEKGDATGAGEGIYWKYESKLKAWDSELCTTIGAAGELFSIRTGFYQSVPKDTYIEDFVMTMRIAQNGYKIAYEPNAFAAEGQSANIGEELKRKIRIAAGGLQTVWRQRSLLNFFKHPVLSFQYFSHRVLRWTLAPLALPVIFILNIIIARSGQPLYLFLLAGQTLFYGFALLGYIFEKKQMKVKAFFIPYYFCIMNYAMFRGFFRLLAGRQSVKWEKAERAKKEIETT